MDLLQNKIIIKEEDNKEDNNLQEENNQEENNHPDNNIINININTNDNKNSNLNANNIQEENKNEKKEGILNNNLINISINFNSKSNINKNENENNLNSDSEPKEEKEKEKEKIIQENQNKIIQIDKIQEKLSNIPVYINSAKSLEINSVPVLIYFIRGKLVRKEILRTFHDFEIFHQTLLDTWPCICIPRLPFKQSIPAINSTIRFPEVKTKLLNHFFKKLSESKELLNCEATKIFLGQDKNYNTKLSNLKLNNNYKEISERYFKIFTDYIEDKKITDEKESFIKKFTKLLDVTYKKLVEIGNTIENEIFNIKKEQNSLDFVTTMFLDLEKSIPSQKKYLTNINDVVNPLKSVSKIKFNIF